MGGGDLRHQCAAAELPPQQRKIAAQMLGKGVLRPAQVALPLRGAHTAARHILGRKHDRPAKALNEQERHAAGQELGSRLPVRDGLRLGGDTALLQKVAAQACPALQDDGVTVQHIQGQAAQALGAGHPRVHGHGAADAADLQRLCIKVIRDGKIVFQIGKILLQGHADFL